MTDYVSKENTLKNIGLLNVSALMGNNKEVDEAIGGYNPSSFLAGLSYGLDHAMGMISSQPTISETEIIRKAFERVVERLEEKEEWTNTHGVDVRFKQGRLSGLRTAISIAKEEGGIE